MIKPILLLAAFLTSLPAWSALTEPDQATLINTKNYATNGGAENGLAAWTVSGTSAVAADLVRDTTNKYEGNAGFAWTPHNANNHLTNTAVTITSNQGLSGANCAAIAWTKTTSTTKTLEAYDGTNILATVTIPSSTVFIPVSVNWICSSSGTNTVRFGTGDTTVLYFDSTKWGDARGVNITQVSQAQLLGTITETGCTGNTYANTSTTFAAFTTLTGCTYATTGQALAPSTNIPAIRFASIPSGELIIQAEGAFGNNTGTKTAYFQFTDGTNTAREISETYSGGAGGAGQINVPSINQSLSYTTAQSNVTLQIYAKTDSGGTATLNAGTAATFPLVIRVYYYPSQSQTAYRPDQTPASWSGYQNGISGGCSTTSTTYADPSACTSIATTQLTARNITCSQAASSAAGITCTLPRVGLYEVCNTVSVTSGAAIAASARIVDGSGSVITPGMTATVGSSGFTTEIAQCGQYSVSSLASATTFKMQIALNATTLTIANGTASGSAAMQWTVKELDAPLAAPYLTGSVTSNTSGQERVERLTFGGGASTMASPTACTSTPCTIVSQSGSWVTGVTRSTNGTYSISFATGEWSSAPTCVFNGYAPGTGGVPCTTQATTTSTTGNTNCQNGGSNVDVWANVICMGPR